MAYARGGTVGSAGRNTPVLQVTTENHWFQRIEVLKRNRTKRRRHGQFVAEGVRLIDTLLQDGTWRIDALAYAAGRRLSDWARGIVSHARCGTVLEVAPDLMARLSEREDASEIVAVVGIPELSRDRIPVTADARIVVLDRIANPGNLGTIVRSADALGAHGIVLTGHCTDPFDPASVRATAGSLCSVPIAEIPSQAGLADWLAGVKARFPAAQVVGTSAHGSSSLGTVDFARPTILMFGSESRGLSVRLRQQCDELVTIPMSGSASSLNLANAVSIVLYEASRHT